MADCNRRSERRLWRQKRRFRRLKRRFTRFERGFQRSERGFRYLKGGFWRCGYQFQRLERRFRGLKRRLPLAGWEQKVRKPMDILLPMGCRMCVSTAVKVWAWGLCRSTAQQPEPELRKVWNGDCPERCSMLDVGGTDVEEVSGE